MMDSFEKFKDLLEKLFEFEASDLDFGIYRILNYKREQIKKFIDEDLKKKVDEAFSKYKDERLEDINEKLKDLKKKIIQALGENAITSTGDIKEEFKETPLGREYLQLKQRKEDMETIDQIKSQVFNDLYNFFSRYYEDGDFIPQYRYSIKGHKYAIPYNGEEIKLYWANYDQYYIKTSTLFRDYTFKADGYTIIFRTVQAQDEIGPNKDIKGKLFVLDKEKPLERLDDKTFIIRFQYRVLTEEEIKEYEVESGSISSKQEKINQRIYEEIISKVDDPHLKKVLAKDYKGKQLLLYQISRFTAKNIRDFFIHKNLKRFLSEQLDYFIKSEVLSIETLEKEKFLDKHITRAKVVREIGEAIIDFLSQIEDFQKRLWEKKKFVIKTEYVITLDKIKEHAGEDFLEEIIDEILKNKEQLEEWKELFGIEVKGKEDLIENKTLHGKEWKKLPIDTRYFSQEFKERLLEKLTEERDLDDILDGLLIKSENWQALNTILPKFKEKVQTIYIDPPFNKEQDADYLYNVKYKDSTWATMLENRLRLARELLNEKGSIFVRCDYNGNWIVRPLMDEIFGKENFRNEIILRKGNVQAALPSRFNPATDFLFFYFKNLETGLFKPIVKKKDHELKWVKMLSPKDNPIKNWCYVNGIKFVSPSGYHWNQSQENIDRLFNEGKIIAITDEGEILSKLPREEIEKLKIKFQRGMIYKLESEELAVDSNWVDIPSYSNITSKLINNYFPTENSEILLKRVIESTSNEGDLVMDFFLGSGTTTAVAHKLKRKWIGIEAGEHFWTVILPRMKKVLAYDKSGISKEKDVKEKYNEKTAGGFFKYQILEQYEDALDNIELTPKEELQEMFKDEYLLKYFLSFETRESPYLLNIQMLKNPFAYKLKVNLTSVGEPQEMVVDIPETFNYLIGLKVKKVKVRNNDGRKYLFVLGEKDDKNIAVVWREYEDTWTEEDFKKDKEFIIKELEDWEPAVVYVNGQSVLTPRLGKLTVEIKCIEQEFGKLMEETVP
ncbi:DNA methyltransferase [Thermocrinis minervae]|uniref:site-specific DNA-methyltransferase (adenine-specific) n=1 Tax=Thermocrinis minervae TaxID=381751 RepID=A0A1M6RGZ7_9AQUI|nr:site-specific DNA-methyltransferase [Thermocrinis minervae]SHK31648.1 adenine-specific DNA-methyltransferase [Thermocrinis minervae]